MPCGLRREERFEDVAARLAIHAGAVVDDRQRDVRAGRRCEDVVGIGVAGRVRAVRGHLDLTGPTRECFARVAEQIHDDLAQLRRIGANCELRRNIERDAHLGRERWRRDAHQLLGDSSELDARRAGATATRVREQLIGELGGAQAGDLDVLDGIAPRLAAGNLAQREVRVAEHGDEQIVEVVGEAAGEQSEALGALRIDDAALELAPGRDVDERAEHADDLAARVPERCDRRRERLAAVFGFALDRLAVESTAMRRDAIDARRIGSERVLQRAADPVIGRETEQLLDGATRADQAQIAIGEPVHRGHLAHHRVEDVALAPQLVLERVDLGEIDDRRVEHETVEGLDDVTEDLDRQDLPGARLPVHAAAFDEAGAAIRLEHWRPLVRIRVHILQQIEGEDFLDGVVAEDRDERRVDDQESSARIGAIHPDGRAVEQAQQLGFGRHGAPL